MKTFHAIVMLLALLALGQLTWAQPVTVVPSSIIKGSSLDDAMQGGAPEFIASPDSLLGFWNKWGLAEEVPEIDFMKSIALVGTTRGSILNLSVILDDFGDLKVTSMGTMDFLPGVRYVMLVVSRTGVKTVNGKAVPTQWEITPIAGFKGSIDDENISSAAPAYITEMKPLQELWANWKIADKIPEVDFSKQIVAISTTVGSILNPSFTLDINGNINVVVMMSKDIQPGFRYTIAVLSREGAKTINGKSLPNVLTIIAVRTGSIADETLLQKTPKYITSEEVLRKLWQKWIIKEVMPAVDFSKELVIVSTTHTSGMDISYNLNAAGNVEFRKVEHNDFVAVPGFRYEFAIISSDGVKSIDGELLPAPLHTMTR